MRSGMLTAYDKGRMRDLWPSEEVCPGFKCGPGFYYVHERCLSHVNPKALLGLSPLHS